MKTKLRTALAIVLAALAFTTAGAYDFMVGGLCYDINSDRTSVTVTCERYDSPRYSNLTGDVTIPSTVTHSGTTYSVTSVGEWAFFKCSGLTSVTIPNSVTSIGDAAFRGCGGLTSVTIPNSVTTICSDAFSNCTRLTSVTIGNSVTSIGNAAFNECSGLTDVTIGNSVTTIGEFAFSGCSGLTSVTIPNSVTSIGYEAFSGCTGLTSIYCQANRPPTCDDNSFGGVDYIYCKLYVPKGFSAVYWVADTWKNFRNIIEMDFDNPEDPDMPDVNGDGKVDIDDLNIVVNYILNH